MLFHKVTTIQLIFLPFALSARVPDRRTTQHQIDPSEWGSLELDIVLENLRPVANTCSWCLAGAQCQGTCDRVLDVMPLSISDQVGGRGFPYWRLNSSPSLGNASTRLETAIIVHHGAHRTGSDYSCYMANAVENAGHAETTLVMAPQIFEKVDPDFQAEKHLWWDKCNNSLGERNWHWGGNSTADFPISISNMQAMDEMAATLADRTLYPNLRKIMFVGHSAGGQLMQRYALFSQFEPREGLKVEYHIANPSSMTYLNSSRPVRPPRTCGAACDNATIAAHTLSATAGQATLAFQAVDQKEPCFKTFDNYGYGLAGALPPYAAKVTKEVAIQQYKGRSVTYISGESDVCSRIFMTCNNCTSCFPDDGELDKSCEADLQGWCRMSRLHGYFQHVREFYGEPLHKLVSIPNVGHNGCAVIQSSGFALAVLHPAKALSQWGTQA